MCLAGAGGSNVTFPGRMNVPAGDHPSQTVLRSVSHLSSPMLPRVNLRWVDVAPSPISPVQSGRKERP